MPYFKIVAFKINKSIDEHQYKKNRKKLLKSNVDEKYLETDTMLKLSINDIKGYFAEYKNIKPNSRYGLLGSGKINNIILSARALQVLFYMYYFDLFRNIKTIDEVIINN
jgi:hypothetical protein